MYGILTAPIRGILHYQQHSKVKGVRDILKPYLQHNVTFEKSEICDIILSERFKKIPQDLRYYSNKFTQSFNGAKLYFSARKLYGEIVKFLNVTTSFFVGSLSVSEIEDNEILQLGEQLATENDLSNRCMDDIGLCRLDANENSVFREPFEHLCYLTGDLLYQMNKNFSQAVEEVNQIYTQLMGELQIYQKNIRALDDNYYQDNFLNLDIYYKQLSIETVVEQPAFTFLSLLSEVGGFLGLLLGASVITVCEVFDFIIVSIVTSIEAKKDVKHKREEEEQELNSKA